MKPEPWRPITELRCEVTDSDFLRSVRTPCWNPVALAVARAMGIQPHLNNLRVTADGVFVNRQPAPAARWVWTKVADLPAVALAELERYNRTERIGRFSFTLLVRSPSP